MKICKDGRIWGQNNREAGDHLGIAKRKAYIKKGGAKGSRNPMYGRTGNQSPRFGISHKEETRRKMSEAKQGAKHPNWKGGIKSEQALIRGQIEFKLWREAVFARDNWTCQECGKRGGGLHAHHIKSFVEYPELRFAIDNGQTLCRKCHRQTKSYGGKR